MKKERYLMEGRGATWLELFFDLIFVVALGQVTHILAHTHEGHLEEQAFLKFVGLFLPFWWIWVGHTVYSNRYDRDSRGHRFTTLILMFFLIVMSGMVGHSGFELYREFLALYAGARIMIAFFYLKESRNPHDKKEKLLLKRTALVYFMNALLALLGVLFEVKIAIVVLYASMGMDILWSIFFNELQIQRPADRDHLVERTGLLAIILLGESIISLASGLDEVNWDREAIITALVGFAMVCMIWWIYFDSFPLLIESERDPHGNAILYSQLFTYMSFALLANTIRHALLLDLDLHQFRIMGFMGISLLYFGKQTAYFINRPEYRKYNIRNTIIVMTLAALSMIPENPRYILFGLTLSFLAYIVVNIFSQRAMYGKTYM